MKALYRRYRPKILSEVIGQEQVTKSLAGALKLGKVSHAYLFIGPRGCGKTSVARILAHEINGFRYDLEDDYVDIIEIDGASNRGIDNIRELREKVMIAPTLGKYKVYIIDEVHMLTKEAFNALLKTLEEPPEHAIFIMATTDAYKVPVTITSRAQTYTFKLADQSIMCNFLKTVAQQEKIRIDEDALAIIAKRGGGSFRDSLSLLDQISTLSNERITKELVVHAMGLPEDEKIVDLLSKYLSGNIAEITTILKDLLSSGIKPETLAEEMITQIMSAPRPELFRLLKDLPEVKAPFAEAKLLVTLCAMVPRGHTDSESTAKKPNSTKQTTSISPQNQKISQPLKAISCQDSSPKQLVETKNISDFDWGKFLEKVKELNDAIYAQLIKSAYEFSDGVLDIYPGKKIIKTILSRDNNKKILVQAADGAKIMIHEIDEKPKNNESDAILTKISDIMGGEVKNDGGRNPFQ